MRQKADILSTMADLAPTPGDEREPLLDVLRALALCVVLVDNTMVSFSGSSYLPDDSPDYFLNESLTGMLFRLLVNLRSMTVMSILFGLGFSMQLARARARTHERGATATYLRRLVVMFGFGIGHVVLLWWGDILWLYALAGLLLLPCRKAGTRTLLVLGLLLAILPRVVVAIPSIEAAVLASKATVHQAKAGMLAAIYGQDYGRVVAAHLRMVIAVHVGSAAWFLPWLGGRFILGFVAGRHRIFERHGEGHLPLFRRLALAGLAVAAVGAAVRMAVMGRTLGLPLMVAVRFFDQAAVLASVVMGMSLVVLVMQHARCRRGLSVLVPIGRMPLTTYLSQTVISTFLFYGWGLGLAHHVQGAKTALIGLLVFAFQLAMATAWIRRYRLGPMEWVWRTLTYGRRQPMRRDAAPFRKEPDPGLSA
ncbi:DUF418 domain-containing protein [Pendulispora albinea]|uniref:DUF418 domain-containing protein n=1 Tax=Pendulispora albinea TaxID=2741071 RepID=A0ABZ2M6S1_9BACT